MSSQVEVKDVTGVLLTGGWSEVDHASFEVHDSPVTLKDGERDLGTIAGGREGLKVCWQVTGIRSDKFAREHPMQVETQK